MGPPASGGRVEEEWRVAQLVTSLTQARSLLEGVVRSGYSWHSLAWGLRWLGQYGGEDSKWIGRGVCHQCGE